MERTVAQWMFPGEDASQAVKGAKDLLGKPFHHEKLYFTGMLTCLFRPTQVLPQKEKQRVTRAKQKRKGTSAEEHNASSPSQAYS